MPFDDRIVGIGLDSRDTNWIEVMWNTHFRARFHTDDEALEAMALVVRHVLAQDKERTFMIARDTFASHGRADLMHRLELRFADLLRKTN